MYYVQNAHAPIISRETFNRAQEELIRRNAIPVASQKMRLSARSRYSKYALTEVMHCAECGSRYRRVTWHHAGKSMVVWRCANRVDCGIKLCPESATIIESDLHAAIVRAVNRFNEEDSASYKTLLNVSLADALGYRTSSFEIGSLTARVDALNNRMMDIVNETLASGGDIESRDEELKDISQEIASLNSQIEAIKDKAQEGIPGADAKLKEISRMIEKLENGITEYDDRVVRQLVECIRVYGDGTLEIIFGGEVMFVEKVPILTRKNNGRKRSTDLPIDGCTA